MEFKKMVIYFRKGYNDIVPFVHEGKDEIHKYMQYEVYDCLYWQDSKSKKSTTMLPFQNYMSESQNISCAI